MDAEDEALVVLLVDVDAKLEALVVLLQQGMMLHVPLEALVLLLLLLQHVMMLVDAKAVKSCHLQP